MQPLSLRRPLISDAAAIEKIQNQGSPQGPMPHWNHEDILKEIGWNHPASVVTEDLTGFIFVRGEHDYEITSMAIDSKHRRRGLARRLVGHVVEIARKNAVSRILLEVSQNNLAALTLYRSCGFQDGRVRKAYYADGSDALEMSLTIALA